MISEKGRANLADGHVWMVSYLYGKWKTDGLLRSGKLCLIIRLRIVTFYTIYNYNTV